MSQDPLAISTEYVRTYAKYMRSETCWPEALPSSLAKHGLTPLDVLHVLKHGDVVECEKETSHGATMVVIGRTCDNVRLTVTFWADDDNHHLKIKSVTVI